MTPEEREQIMRQVHMGYVHGLVSREQSMRMMQQMQQEYYSYNLPTHEIITGTFRFTEDTDEFLLDGAL